MDSGDPWKPRPATVDKVMKMLQGVHKVLKPEGTFISISFGQVMDRTAHSLVIVHFPFAFSHIAWLCNSLQPHFRRPLFEGQGFTWAVDWKTFGEGFHYFFYTLKKVC